MHHVFCIDVSSRSLAIGLAAAAIHSACKAIDALLAASKETVKVGVVSFACDTIQFYSVRAHSVDPFGKYRCIHVCSYIIYVSTFIHMYMYIARMILRVMCIYRSSCRAR
jgi:hypothetical protein